MADGRPATVLVCHRQRACLPIDLGISCITGSVTMTHFRKKPASPGLYNYQRSKTTPHRYPTTALIPELESTMSSSFILPSHFGSPFLTTLPATRYDAKGRQLNFTESEVQRLERLAFVNASKSRSNSPVQGLLSPSASPVPSSVSILPVSHVAPRC